MPAGPDAQIRLKGNYYADPEFFRTNVLKGVTRTPGGTRICTLPSDFLLGFRDALIYECGRSYRSVMKATGKRWGIQFAKRLDRELTAFYQCSFKELPIGIVRTCLTDAFNYHGYGRLTFEPHAAACDVFVAEVHDPIVPSLVREADRPVDMLTAGMLGALFSHLSGRSLDAVQTDCPALGADRSRFVVGPAVRISGVEQWIDESEEMPSHDAILLRLVTNPEDNDIATPPVVATA